MKKWAAFSLVLACFVSCQTRKPLLVPQEGPFFRIVGIKFTFRDGHSKQNGRISWRVDGERSKIVFFTPLNQMGLELDVAGEDAVLVNFARKEHWRGEFRQLLERMWGVDMSLATLKELLLSGAVQRDELAEKGIEIELERGPAGGAAKTVRLRRGDADLTLRLTRDESRPGQVILTGYENRYRAADLASVLEMEE